MNWHTNMTGGPSDRPNLSRGLYSDGTMGHSGSSTSEERAIRDTLSPRRAQVYEVVASAGYRGVTVGQVQEALGIGHGSASGALTVLHRGRNVVRLKMRRNRQEVYVLPKFVSEREESPYRPNSGKSRIEELEKRVVELEESEEKYARILDRQSDILTRTANVLKGEPEDLHSHSHHDLAEMAAEKVALIQRMTSVTEAQMSAVIKDAYYGARDNGGTMHTAADDAARRVMAMLNGEQG